MAGLACLTEVSLNDIRTSSGQYYHPRLKRDEGDSCLRTFNGSLVTCPFAYLKSHHFIVPDRMTSAHPTVALVCSLPSRQVKCSGCKPTTDHDESMPRSSVQCHPQDSICNNSPTLTSAAFPLTRTPCSMSWYRISIPAVAVFRLSPISLHFVNHSLAFRCLSLALLLRCTLF
jgi:hypothetical protein